VYELYYYPRNASLAPHLVLEELGLEFKLILVDREANAHNSADYLALNPTGKIPALVDNDLVMFESAAICLYLCEHSASSNLIPQVNTSSRALFYQWLMYLTNTIQSGLMVYYYPERHTTDKAATAEISAAQEGRITEMFALLDRALVGKNFLVSEHITVCDYFLLMLCMWAEEFTKPPLSFPHLGAHLRKLTKRRAVLEVCKREQLNLSKYN
jgi:glutathione S-transferase